jgi:uncharacterized protein (TIGR03067 family)
MARMRAVPGVIAFLLAAATSGFAPAPFLPPPKKAAAKAEVDALMGDWHNPAIRSVVVNITPTEFAFINSGRRDNVYKLTLDVTKAPFKFDIRQPMRNFVGIWKVEGDKLTIRYNSERPGLPDGGRPTSFEAPGNQEVYSRVVGKKGAGRR